MSYEPETLPDDIEHIDRRPSPIKKQKEKVITYVCYMFVSREKFLLFKVTARM